jgi:hypothetical protein
MAAEAVSIPEAAVIISFPQNFHHVFSRIDVITGTCSSFHQPGRRPRQAQVCVIVFLQSRIANFTSVPLPAMYLLIHPYGSSLLIVCTVELLVQPHKVR